MEYFTLFIGAVLINNFVLTKFLGLCIFFGVSKNLDASIGMGFAVTSVITMSTVLAWLLYNFVLVPFGLTFLRTISFVVLIASFVQLLEIVIKKQSPTLYNMWGIYLMLIATNCIRTGYFRTEWLQLLGKPRLCCRFRFRFRTCFDTHG